MRGGLLSAGQLSISPRKKGQPDSGTTCSPSQRHNSQGNAMARCAAGCQEWGRSQVTPSVAQGPGALEQCRCRPWTGQARTWGLGPRKLFLGSSSIDFYINEAREPSGLDQQNPHHPFNRTEKQKPRNTKPTCGQCIQEALSLHSWLSCFCYQLPSLRAGWVRASAHQRAGIQLYKMQP